MILRGREGAGVQRPLEIRIVDCGRVVDCCIVVVSYCCRKSCTRIKQRFEMCRWSWRDWLILYRLVSIKDRPLNSKYTHFSSAPNYPCVKKVLACDVARTSNCRVWWINRIHLLNMVKNLRFSSINYRAKRFWAKCMHDVDQFPWNFWWVGQIFCILRGVRWQLNLPSIRVFIK